ncbi:DUF4112 domain-containing protein [Pseudoalteromonas fuliginea]|uniref:DUF4112 domain-containing protein n=1 Tax=Pseudoalteromonas fuliginea TaxID=1872678 RepID=A0A833AHM4_9GAMM|nr:DUF4112 domain-containing protein [Pseudoalteromonas fuliginea]KAA1156487.1 DUF4112 domain-containing protein [Pseudoalteromonas fuliginea]KAA1156652.1 DUF4112 domain-containing protein [Pseudoalteromonas fuliginea]KAA1167481.1 DUF4112 domain-containing protein [Pseudoalteromonas fuliginea]
MNNNAKQKATLARLERFSQITDSSIRIPFTNFKFGVEAIIGIVPVIGDFAGLILSSYVLFEAQRLGVSWHIKFRILLNIAIDFIGGLVPILGDIFDAFFKANTRNTCLLKNHIKKI